MPDQWFRWRRPDEGQGYSVTRKQGWLAIAAFTAATTLALVVPIRSGGSLGSIVFGIVTISAATVLLLRTIRRHSDWHG